MKRTPKQMFATLLATAALSMAISGCASKEKPSNAIGDIPPGSFVKAWEAEIGLKKVERLFLGDQTLLVYGKGNQVAAYDTKGSLKFYTQVGEENSLVGPPAVQPERILFPMGSTIEIVSHQGVKRDSIVLDNAIRSPIVAQGETFYAGTDSKTGARVSAIALDRKYALIRREVLTRSVILTKPALHDNVIYAATVDGRVFALNSDMTQLWPYAPEMADGIFHTDGRIEAAIKADEGGVYVPSTDKKLYCLDLVTGKIRWQYIAGVPLTESPVPTSDTVYIRVKGKGLVAIDKKAGVQFREPRWANQDAKQVLSDDAKYVYCLTDSGRILALDKANGKVAFQSDRNDFVSGVTHIDPKDSTIFVLTKTSDLVAIRPVLKTGVVGELVMLDSKNEQIATR